jgi:hypothetical protein
MKKKVIAIVLSCFLSINITLAEETNTGTNTSENQLSEHDKQTLADLKDRLEHPNYYENKEPIVSNDTARGISKSLAIFAGLWAVNFFRKRKNNEK